MIFRENYFLKKKIKTDIICRIFASDCYALLFQKQKEGKDTAYYFLASSLDCQVSEFYYLKYFNPITI